MGCYYRYYRQYEHGIGNGILIHSLLDPQKMPAFVLLDVYKKAHFPILCYIVSMTLLMSISYHRLIFTPQASLTRTPFIQGSGGTSA